MLIYATPTDLTNWTSTAAPTNALSLLRSASLLVAQAVRGAIYDTDPVTLQPTDPIIIEALLEATCIQVHAWDVNDIDPDVIQVAVKSSVKIGTAQIGYTGAEAAFEAKQFMARNLVPQAVDVLFTAGLTAVHVRQSFFPYYLTPVQNPWFTP